MFIKSNQRLLIKWVLISCMGWLIAQTIGIVLTRAAYPQAEFNTLVTAPLYWIIFGIVFGFSQWIVLGDYVPNTLGWVLATALGFYLAALLLNYCFDQG